MEKGKTVADRLREARLEKGFTVKDVAEGCNITESAVRMYEIGQRVPRDGIKIRMAKFFGKTVQNLFF